MPAKLKVFRTPIGFHDAYVAAPSQKAALAAWGADADLFARGVAERVTDPALIEEPLANPGKVIRRTRGSESEHIAALKATPSPARKAPATTQDKPRREARPARPKPRPARDRLDAAEAALEEAREHFASERTALDREETELQRKRERLRADERREEERLIARRDDEEARYEAAMDRWRKG